MYGNGSVYGMLIDIFKFLVSWFLVAVEVCACGLLCSLNWGGGERQSLPQVSQEWNVWNSSSEVHLLTISAIQNECHSLW